MKIYEVRPNTDGDPEFYATKVAADRAVKNHNFGAGADIKVHDIVPNREGICQLLIDVFEDWHGSNHSCQGPIK